MGSLLFFFKLKRIKTDLVSWEGGWRGGLSSPLLQTEEDKDILGAVGRGMGSLLFFFKLKRIDRLDAGRGAWLGGGKDHAVHRIALMHRPVTALPHCKNAWTCNCFTSL